MGQALVGLTLVGLAQACPALVESVEASFPR